MANKFNNFEKFDRKKKSNSPIFLSSDLLITSQVPLKYKFGTKNEKYVKKFYLVRG